MGDLDYRTHRRNASRLQNAAADIRALQEQGIFMDLDTYGELLEKEPPSEKDARRFVETIVKLSSPFIMMDFALSSDTAGCALPSTGFPAIYNCFQGITRGDLMHNQFQGNQIKPMRLTFNMDLIGQNNAFGAVRIMAVQWNGPIVSSGVGGQVTSPTFYDILNVTTSSGIYEPMVADVNWTNRKICKVIFDGIWHYNSYASASLASSGAPKDRIPIVIERDLDNEKFNNVCWRDASGTPNYDPYKGGIVILIDDTQGAFATRSRFNFNTRIVAFNQ